MLLGKGCSCCVLLPPLGAELATGHGLFLPLTGRTSSMEGRWGCSIPRRTQWTHPAHPQQREETSSEAADTTPLSQSIFKICLLWLPSPFPCQASLPGLLVMNDLVRVPPVPGARSCEAFFPGGRCRWLLHRRARSCALPARPSTAGGCPRHKGTENAINEEKRSEWEGMLGCLKELTQPPAARPVTSTSGLATAGLGSRRQRCLGASVGVAIPKGASWRWGKHNFPSLSSESPSEFFLASGSLSRGKAQLLLLLPADRAGCGCYELCSVCVLNHCRDREHLPSLWGQRGSPRRLGLHKFDTPLKLFKVLQIPYNSYFMPGGNNSTWPYRVAICSQNTFICLVSQHSRCY